MKLLYYGESPLNPTGFGQVNKHLLRAASHVFDDIKLVASTHYHKEYDRTEYPYEIIACDDTIPRDLVGQRNLANIEKQVKGLDWDVFMYQGDMGANNDVLAWVGEIQKAHPEKHSIFYMPIDGDISLGFAFNVFGWCSVPVVYTNHGHGVIEQYAPDVAKVVSVIWLGCETETFYPLSPEEKRAARLEYFGAEYAEKFLVMNVNRNQVRKDLARCMAAFHLFHEKYPESMLYMHSVQQDAGGSLIMQAQVSGCKVFERPAEVAFSSLDLANPISRASLNRIYNAVDCLVSTSYGEGWGLTTTEAMCTGLPVVVPDNTANWDIIGRDEERGWLVKSGGDLDHMTFIYQNGGGPVPHIHAISFVEKLAYVYEHREEAEEKAVHALAWCRENSWERRESEWEQLFKIIKAQSSSSQPELASL